MAFDLDQVEDIQLGKSVVIHELFVRTADENYLAARWCFSKNLRLDFKWLALHSLEKYLKAALLINGQSAKSYGHNLVDPFHALQNIAGSLLPHPALQIESILERLESYGNAQNRYNLYGNVHGSVELGALDFVVFLIRRLICPLEELSENGQTYKSELSGDQCLRHPKSCLLDIALGNEAHPLHHVACNGNRAFAPANYQHSDPTTWSIGASSSVISTTVLDPMLGAKNEADARMAAELVDWLVGNVRLPNSDIALLNEAKSSTFSRLRI
jgi:hypothetical protein